MAAVADTAAAQDTGEQNEGNGVDIDINTWLSKNRLNKFKQYFQENEVILEDLLTYNEDEMNSVINECNITATAYKKRFKDSIRSLQFKSNKTSTGSSQIYRVVMSSKESEAMDGLKLKLTEINKLMQENKSGTDKLSNNAQNIENDIKSAFTEMRRKMDEREKALMIKLNDISNDHSNKLKDQNNYLNQYQKSIEEAMNTQNALLLDPNIDSTKRQINIEQITKNTLNNIDDNQTKIELTEIRFNIDNKAINEYISNIGVVSTKADPPTVQITDIKSNTAKVAIECKVDDDKIKYNLKYKPKNDDEDDEKKTNWTEVDIDDKNEYILQNLKQNTKYEVCARYKASTDTLFSRYSPNTIFKTLDKCGEWDGNYKSSKLSLNGDVVTVIKNGWSTIWLKEIVSNGKHEWNFKILKNVEQYSDFGIGFVNENDTKNKDSYVSKFCLMLSSKTGICIYNEKGGTKYYKQRVNEKDVVTMIADFNNKRLTFKINGQDVGECITFIAGSYRAAVSLYSKENSFQLM